MLLADHQVSTHLGHVLIHNSDPTPGHRLEETPFVDLLKEERVLVFDQGKGFESSLNDPEGVVGYGGAEFGIGGDLKRKESF
jgi:hypothetical protein